MAAIKYFILFLVYKLSICASLDIGQLTSDVKIKNVDRKIDITTQLEKVTSKITIQNTGKSPIKNFVLAFEKKREQLAYIGLKDSNTKDLKLTEHEIQDFGEVTFFVADLKAPVNAGSTAVFVCEMVITRSLVPYPASITQAENQFTEYTGNVYFYSPYAVESQKTTILSSKNVESYTKVSPHTFSDKAIDYGPFTNVNRLSLKPINVHYINNSPFLTVTQLERVIEVSHWGNIAIEETIKVIHSGAKLSGPFSRYDYQQDHYSGPSSVRSYKTVLPASAADVYYRDSNGNISTSNMKVKKDSVELELRPRFPLFGGWKTHYTLGYNVPSYEYLYQQGNEYLLKMRAVDHIFDDMHIDELITKVILPEGSTNIKLNIPYPVTRLPDTLHYTYLDTKGRPVISFKKNNVVENHIQDFQLRYTFPRLLMFQEPLLVVAFLYALFLCVIVYVRLDFSIHKSEPLKEHKE